jgi:hypothetical protein
MLNILFKIILILFVIFLFSCNINYEYPEYNIRFPDFLRDEFNGNTKHDILIIYEWTSSIIRLPYIDSPDWQEPIITFNKRWGDTIDIFIFTMWVIYQELNIKPELVFFHDFETYAPAICYKDIFIYCNKKDFYVFYNSFSFDDTMYLAKYKW